MLEKIPKKLWATLLACIIVFATTQACLYSMRIGYMQGVADVIQAIRQAGFNVTITDLGNGKYEIHIIKPTASGQPQETVFNLELHMLVQHFRDGKLISQTYHPMTLTNFGKDWIANKTAGLNGNWNLNATYIGCSNDSSSVDVTWTVLPNEITTNGLARSQGSITDTGTGTWNCTVTFQATGTVSTKLYGYYLDASGNTLIAAEQQGVSNQKNLQNGDTLTITIQGSIS